MKTRLVLDTNVVLSSLLFPSSALSWLRGAWQSGRICPLLSRQTAAELIRVLAYPKFKLIDAEQRDLVDDYVPHCETVEIPSPPPETPLIRDPFDRPFLELALAGRADALITGDADLLSLQGQFAIPILSPTTVAALLETESPPGKQR